MSAATHVLESSLRPAQGRECQIIPISLPHGTLAALSSEVSELREENARLRAKVALRDCALDTSHSHFLVFNVQTPGRTIVFVNQAFAASYGYEPRDLVGKPIETLGATLGVELWNQERAADVERAICEGEELRIEAEVVRRDGSKFWAGFHLAPMRDSHGNITHYLATGADITAKLEAERKKREVQDRLYNEMRERERLAIELRLANKLESVGRLAAGLGQEINVPVRAVEANIHFLRYVFQDMKAALSGCQSAVGALPESLPVTDAVKALRTAMTNVDLQLLGSETAKAFERTQAGMEHITKIIDGMRDFAQAGTAKLAPADLNQAIRTTLAVASFEYKLVADVVLQLRELPAVNCSIGELNQAFLTLVVNAAQAVVKSGKDADNGGQIKIASGVSGDHVEITIADNGCGISDENLEKIFDPFFTTKEGARGTGQGLAMVRSIVVDRHGGTIQVRSVVGMGTHFIIRLPIRSREA